MLDDDCWWGGWQLDWLGSIARTLESGRSWRRMSPLDWVGPTTGEWTVRLFWLAVIEKVWLSSFWIFNSHFVERDVCLLGKSVEELIALNPIKSIQLAILNLCECDMVDGSRLSSRLVLVAIYSDKRVFVHNSLWYRAICDKVHGLVLLVSILLGQRVSSTVYLTTKGIWKQYSKLLDPRQCYEFTFNQVSSFWWI